LQLTEASATSQHPHFHSVHTTASLAAEFGQLWLPPERLSLSQWVEANITLSSEYAARTGNMRLFGWQREVFDAFTDPNVREIVVCSSTQMLKTIALQCILAYVIVCEPAPILLVQPNDDDARTFSKERLSPMIRDNACLRGLLSDSTHDGKNTIVGKVFPGGSLSIVGSISPSNLARRSICYLLCDEVDLYPLSASKGDLKVGNPIGLAEKRMATYGSRAKGVYVCSPTVAGRSVILDRYAASDQRKPWVQCWSCGEWQILKWRDAKGYRVRWDSSLAPKLQATTAVYYCPHCDSPWSDLQRHAACERAQWRAESDFTGIAGFWISHLYSPWPRQNISSLAAEFIEAGHDRNKLQVFINTSLAEGWQDEGETPDHELLYSRREEYPHGDEAIVPARGLFLTAAVDVQDNPPRLEVEVKAWGRNRENWSIAYLVIQCRSEDGELLPVSSKQLWDRLDAEVLARNWPHESGHTLPIRIMCIDTGSRPKPVYEFARTHPQLNYNQATGNLTPYAVRTVVPTKGVSTDTLRIISSVSKEDAARKRQGVRIIGIGTICAKQEIFDALRALKPSPDGTLSGSPVPGCYHFPQYAMPYFEGLSAEVRIVKPDGRVVYEKRGARNEPIDLAVYNRAAAALAGIDRLPESGWQKLEASLGVLPLIVRSPSPGAEAAPVVTPAPPVPQPPQPAITTTSPALRQQQGQPTSVLNRSIRGRFFR
jgi:phage terminase large subunit GpA-like protein